MSGAPVLLRRHVQAPPERVWALLTDFGAHGRWFPLTRMELQEGSPRLGWEFTGVTGVGPLAFRDPMLITRWEPPSSSDAGGVVEMRKTGRVLDGWARIQVLPSAGGTDVVWREQITPRPGWVGRRVGGLGERATTAMLEHVLDAVCREAQDVDAPGGSTRAPRGSR